MPVLSAPVPCPVQLVLADERSPISRPRASGAFYRVRHRVYVRKADWDGLTPWDRYLVRVHAVALARPGSVFCLESAAVLLGLPIFGEPRDIHLLDTARTLSHRRGDVVLHGSVDTRPLWECDGIRVTAVAHTAADLIRVLPPAFGLAVADAAIAPRQIGACHVDDIRAAAADQANRRGRRLLDWAVQRADPRSESSGESVSRAVIEWLGYPSPELQATFTFEGVTDRTDFFWPEYGMVGESDGYGKYDADDKEAMKAHFIKEKLREDRLRRHLERFGRWDWANTMRVTPLDRVLQAAGLPRVNAQQPAMLATLRSAPRSIPPAKKPRPHR